MKKLFLTLVAAASMLLQSVAPAVQAAVPAADVVFTNGKVYTVEDDNPWAAAYGIGVEDKIGTIEVGKLADLIVLDQNLFEIDPHDIHKAKVELTMMDGVVRYRDGI